MLRYRIAQNALGRYIVLSAFLFVVPIGQTYATRAEAQEDADRLNGQGQATNPSRETTPAMTPAA